MMAEERSDPGRSARSSVAEYRTKGREVAGERNGLSLTPPSLDSLDMLDAGDDERKDDLGDGERDEFRLQDSMNANELSLSWKWCPFFWSNSGLRIQLGTVYCRIVLM